VINGRLCKLDNDGHVAYSSVLDIMITMNFERDINFNDFRTLHTDAGQVVEQTTLLKLFKLISNNNVEVICCTSNRKFRS